ncbi:MAG: hypothetical protein Q7J07_06875 [Pelolinea sp.]|nr:hypothetical protein [Pelolinea sp.]
MKKIFIMIITILIMSGCVLVPVSPSTPFPSSQTQIIGTLPPTATEAQSQINDDTPAPIATLVPTFTDVPTQLPALTNTPQSTATPFPIKLQSGSPAYIKNFAHPSDGCAWLGVAGQVFGMDGKPLLNNVAMVTGKIDGKTIEIVGVTGIPEADIYGPGGYEIKISDQISNSEDLLSIQIFNLNGIPISEVVPFDTYADCGKNLIIINFHYKD